jgi:hypothetical protein
MDAQTVREHAESWCAALVEGDMTRAVDQLSRELQANAGQIVAILPLPLTEATVESVEVGGSGYVAMLRLVGENGEIELQTRWKDRDGTPTIVEASHVAEPVPAEVAPAPGDATTYGIASGCPDRYNTRSGFVAVLAGI